MVELKFNPFTISMKIHCSMNYLDIVDDIQMIEQTVEIFIVILQILTAIKNLLQRVKWYFRNSAIKHSFFKFLFLYYKDIKMRKFSVSATSMWNLITNKYHIYYWLYIIFIVGFWKAFLHLYQESFNNYCIFMFMKLTDEYLANTNV